MKASTLVFDLDGTLTDPSEGIANCVNHALVEHGYSSRSVAEVSAEIGPPLDLMLSKFIPGISEQQIAQLVQSYRQRFNVVGYAENRLYDNIITVIPELRKTFKLGVCTSKPEAPARKVLEHFGLLQYFEFVSGGDIGVAKQSQLQNLLARGDIDQNAIMIGDRNVDLIAAHNNQLRSAAVLWGFGEFEELTAEKPALLLETVDQLVGCFQS